MISSTLQGLTIPEGIVKQITDALGNVLWSAVKNAKVTITSQWDGFDGDSASITVKSNLPFAPDPTNPSNKVTSWTVFVYDQPNCTIEVPVGSTIECTISRDKGNADSYISVNGTNMVTGEGSYTYTVAGDVTISIIEEYSQGDYGIITIIEAGYVPEIISSMILRPSADISVGHELVPVSSTEAYLLINEEVSDGSSTYIRVLNNSAVSESKFAMTNTTQLEVSKYTILSAIIYADTPYENKSDNSYYEFILEINGIETSAYRFSGKNKGGFTISAIDAIPLINEVVAVTGMLPNINIIIKSYGGEYVDGNKGGYDYCALSQVYVTLGYEGY